MAPSTFRVAAIYRIFLHEGRVLRRKEIVHRIELIEFYLDPSLVHFLGESAKVFLSSIGFLAVFQVFSYDGRVLREK
jgi:hypothetical protein